jgi:hypothetical protein
MHRRFAPALVAALLFAGSAAAQPGPSQGGPPAERPEGRLFLSPAGEPFRGGDGLAAWFARADADKDGALALAEFRADAMTFFKALDQNGDGSVDGTENSRYEQRIAPEITQLFLGGPNAEGERPRKFISKTGKKAEPRQGAARFSLLNEPQPVRGADFDLNQKVSSEEWAKAAGRRFGLLDGAGDGKLTLAELAPRKP